MRTINLFPVCLFVSLSFWSCKKSSDPSPVPGPDPESPHYPFKIKLVYPEADTTNPVVMVKPNDVLKLIFSISSDERITVIDLLAKDHWYGETRLKGYPFVVSSGASLPEGDKVQILSNNSVYLTKEIRIPSYAKDSVVLTMKVVKYDLSSRSIKLVLKVKKEIDFTFESLRVNNFIVSSQPVSVYSGEAIRSFYGSINTSSKLVQLKADLWVEETRVATESIPFRVNSSDTYNEGGSSEIHTYRFDYFSYNSDNWLMIKKEYEGKNTRIRVTAVNEKGDSISSVVPVRIETKDLLFSGPFNLGAALNMDYGQFLITVRPSPLVSFNPLEGNSYSDPFSVVGFFRQNGEHRLASISWIYPNRVSLGYTLPNNFYDQGYRTYFRKVTRTFEEVDSWYLDTMRINATAPQVISVQPNDVIVFASREVTNQQKGVLKVHSFTPGDSGFVTLSIKYPTR